jgi:SPP1 family predicted phage head-tail adaptor
MLQSRIRRGELDKTITFIKKVIEESDSNEDYEGGWEPIATDSVVYAKLEQMPANDVLIADRITNVMRTQAIIDYREDLNTQMRFVYKTRPYEIISITEHEEGRNTYLVVVGVVVDTELYT